MSEQIKDTLMFNHHMLHSHLVGRKEFITVQQGLYKYNTLVSLLHLAVHWLLQSQLGKMS